jgi:uncharacterized tellurite resistance protein B-like protein
MFGNTKAFFSGEGSLNIDKDGIPSAEDLQLAVIALLVSIGKADAHFSAEEVNKITSVAATQLGLAPTQTGSLLEIAQFMISEDESRLDDFIAAIRSNFDDAQRMRLLGMVWKVIMADGKVTEEEPQVAVTIRKALDLSLEQAVRAQQMAQDGEYDGGNS